MMSISREQLVAKRDKKVQDMFGTLAPVWLVNDKYKSPEDSFFFDVIYCHPVDGWINEHIRYDTFNDVLYHLGERYLSEEAALEIQDVDPYVSGSGTASIPNNPANRY